jgi:hypothetical protein
VPLAADADEAADKRICSFCIGDGYLKAKVRREGVTAIGRSELRKLICTPRSLAPGQGVHGGSCGRPRGS